MSVVAYCPALVPALSFQGAVVLATHGVEGPRTKFAADGSGTDPDTRDALDELVSAVPPSTP